MGKIYDMALKQKNKFPGTICWRLAKHCAVAEKHLNPDEIPIYVFSGQKNDDWKNFFDSCVVVVTNKRLLVAQKNVFPGYSFSSITPDLYNDLQVYTSIFWGKVVVDTVKEVITISNLSKSALPEIETNITEFMMEAKQKYQKRDDKKKDE
jgi:hypothetical protein